MYTGTSYQIGASMLGFRTSTECSIWDSYKKVTGYPIINISFVIIYDKRNELHDKMIGELPEGNPTIYNITNYLSTNKATILSSLNVSGNIK